MGMTRKQADEMWQHFKLSGNFAAIDSHTMINGSIKNFVDGITPAKTVVGRVVQISAMPISFLRKVGFDAGENFSQTVTWAAERFAAIERGEDMIDPTVRDRVAARATQFTGNKIGRASCRERVCQYV